MKIYTGRGDDGTTGLLGGGRVSKYDPRFEACGTIDELNAVIGWSAVAATPPTRELLHQIQDQLFVIGAHVAVAHGSGIEAGLPPLDQAWAARMEAQMDAADAELPPLSQFIHPGGCESAARLHVARTVCRRAERMIVALAQAQPLSELILVYLNRLGDWLFVQVRLANLHAGAADVPWRKEMDRRGATTVGPT